jgi:hypothetical protein
VCVWGGGVRERMGEGEMVGAGGCVRGWERGGCKMAEGGVSRRWGYVYCTQCF